MKNFRHHTLQGQLRVRESACGRGSNSAQPIAASKMLIFLPMMRMLKASGARPSPSDIFSVQLLQVVRLYQIGDSSQLL
eukprot:2949571-Amphidinium_carterae.2